MVDVQCRNIVIVGEVMKEKFLLFCECQQKASTQVQTHTHTTSFYGYAREFVLSFMFAFAFCSIFLRLGTASLDLLHGTQHHMHRMAWFFSGQFLLVGNV